MEKVIKKPNSIKAAIPYGGISDIAKRSGTSIFTVSRVINGKSRNGKVLTEINKYLSEINGLNEMIKENVIAICQ